MTEVAWVLHGKCSHSLTTHQVRTHTDAMDTTPAPSPWQNRITGSGVEATDQLLANPLNWRVHPRHQQEVLESVLDEVGWVQQVIVNQQTGHVVDGHLRIALALRREEQQVPVLYVDLTESEEQLIIATLDPVGALAVADKQQLASLLSSLDTDREDIAHLVQTIAGQYHLEDLADPQGLAGSLEECTCPLCGHHHKVQHG